MADFDDFIGQYITLDFSPRNQALYCLIDKVDGNSICLIPPKSVEKAGLLIDDILGCRIIDDEKEYFFEAKLVNFKKGIVDLALIIQPTTEIEEFFNLRSEKRIDYKFIAITSGDILASVKNISKTGISFISSAIHKKGDLINVSLITHYIRIECTVTGIVMRVNRLSDNKTDYGVKILEFGSFEEEKAYKHFVDIVEKDLLSL